LAARAPPANGRPLSRHPAGCHGVGVNHGFESFRRWVFFHRDVTDQRHQLHLLFHWYGNVFLGLPIVVAEHYVGEPSDSAEMRRCKAVPAGFTPQKLNNLLLGMGLTAGVYTPNLT
jgi:hypothetical protein